MPTTSVPSTGGGALTFWRKLFNMPWAADAEAEPGGQAVRPEAPPPSACPIKVMTSAARSVTRTAPATPGGRSMKIFWMQPASRHATGQAGPEAAPGRPGREGPGQFAYTGCAATAKPCHTWDIAPARGTGSGDSQVVTGPGHGNVRRLPGASPRERFDISGNLGAGTTLSIQHHLFARPLFSSNVVEPVRIILIFCGSAGASSICFSRH